MQRFVALCSIVTSGAMPGRAQQAERILTTAPANTIRSWGDASIRSVLETWQQGFRATHPQVQFKNSLYGSGSGMAGIITGTSELAVMGRPATANEIMGFQWAYRYKPLAIQVMTSGLGTEGESPALAVVVNVANPLRRIRLTQLKAMLGCPEQTGAVSIQTWGQLGLAGPWAHRPIHGYLYNNEMGTGEFLQTAILGTGDKWDWSRVREYRDTPAKTAGKQIAEALQSDPDGIAITTPDNVTPSMRVLDIAPDLGSNYFPLTRATLVSRDYPLARAIYIYVNRPPGQPLQPLVLEFLRFILGPRGQQMIAGQGNFLPLNATLAAEQSARLQ